MTLQDIVDKVTSAPGSSTSRSSPSSRTTRGPSRLLQENGPQFGRCPDQRRCPHPYGHPARRLRAIQAVRRSAHLNVHAREEFRHHSVSLTSPSPVAGLGWRSYISGLESPSASSRSARNDLAALTNLREKRLSRLDASLVGCASRTLSTSRRPTALPLGFHRLHGLARNHPRCPAHRLDFRYFEQAENDALTSTSSPPPAA